MTDDAAPDLRARRRLDTHHEIHAAALELFETQGVRDTTVQQIADRAGISARTFFRYFDAKEQAALPGQRRLLHAIDTLEITAPGLESALRAIEAATESVLDLENDPELHEHRRVARLLAREPELQALAASQEVVLASHLRARVAALLDDADPTATLLLAETAVAVWRTTWQRWGELAIAGDVRDPAALYRECCAALRDLAG